jgi:hypothetical protein
MEQHAEPVVLEAAEAVAAALDLFTHRFRPSVGPFDAPVAWWARISRRHERRDLPRLTISGTSSARQPTMALSNRVRASAHVSAR